MNYITSSNKAKCVCCGRKTAEFFSFKRSGIEILIPLCEKHREVGTFNICGGLKNIVDTINHMVTLSHICGEDERTISEYQRREREKALAERKVNPSENPQS